MSSGTRLELVLFLGAALAFAFGYGLSQAEAPGFELVPRAEGTLRVMTWNVGGSAREGEWGGPLADEHLEHVAGVLRELDPDLCFLEEVRGGSQAQRLHDALGEGWQLEYSSSTGGRRIVALAQRGRLELLRFEAATSRSIAVRHFAETGELLTAVGLHADVTSARARNQEIGALAAELAELEGATLLAGDFNLDLDLGKRRDLFTDDEYLDVETYNFVTRHFEDATLGTGSTAEPDRRLDYLFLAPGKFELLSAGPLRGRRVGDMDHDPVVADLVR